MSFSRLPAFHIALPKTQNLPFLAAIAINRNAFAAQLVGKQIYLFNIFGGSAPRQIDCLADGVIDILLESGLYAHVMCCRHLVGNDKEFLELCRGGQPFQRSLMNRFLDQASGQLMLLRFCDEIPVNLRHLFRFHDAMRESQSKERLNAAAAAGDDGNGSRWGDGGSGGISYSIVFSARIVAAPGKVGKNATNFC